MAGENGDPVEPLLSVNGELVAQRFKFQPGEILVQAFNFLQTGHIGFGFLQPFQQARQARLDAVNVEGRYFQREWA